MSKKRRLTLEEYVNPVGIRVTNNWNILDVKGEKVGEIYKCFGKYSVAVFRKFKTKEDALEWVREALKGT